MSPGRCHVLTPCVNFIVEKVKPGLGTSITARYGFKVLTYSLQLQDNISLEHNHLQRYSLEHIHSLSPLLSSPLLSQVAGADILSDPGIVDEFR